MKESKDTKKVKELETLEYILEDYEGRATGINYALNTLRAEKEKVDLQIVELKHKIDKA